LRKITSRLNSSIAAGPTRTDPPSAGDYQGDTWEEDPLAHGELEFGELLQAARDGAPWAFARLYADLSPAVAGYLRAQRATEPEDLTSEVFLGVFRGLMSFEGSEQRFRSWVFTIAHRRLQDERRRAARSPHFASMDGATHLRGGDVEQEALALLGDEWVLRISEDLSAEQRTVLLLRTIADLTAEEVSQITGKTEGAVRALQRRALESLRRKFARKGVRL
jgi:RNA polymerase sigma factor (sigma-70 family)